MSIRFVSAQRFRDNNSDVIVVTYRTTQQGAFPEMKAETLETVTLESEDFVGLTQAQRRARIKQAIKDKNTPQAYDGPALGLAPDDDLSI